MIDEDLKKFLPTFLSSGEQEELFYNLKQLIKGDISRVKNFYINASNDRLLEQGDVIDGVDIFNLPMTTPTEGKGFIISNTCDVNPDNDRAVPMGVMYAPVLNLEKYENRLKAEGLYSEDWGRSVRMQQITNLVYLPAGLGMDYEAIVPLDKINSMASDYITPETASSNRVSRLSLTGWYILLIKITHHFARTTNELISRKSPT